MKKIMPEQYRAQPGEPFNSLRGDPCGVFFVPFQSQVLRIIVSAGDVAPDYPWDHVSVSLKNRCPNWPEMCHIKDLFFDEDEVVVQYHPPKKRIRELSSVLSSPLEAAERKYSASAAHNGGTRHIFERKVKWRMI